MLWTIGVLAVGATCAGFLNIPQVERTRSRNFLDPPLLLGIEPSGGQELGTLGARGRARAASASSPRTRCGAGAARRPGASPLSTAPLERVLQDKFGFDRLYDWAFYRPAAALARGGAAASGRTRAVIGSMNVVAATGSWTSRLLSTAQSGLVRVYALAIARRHRRSSPPGS